MSEYNSYAMKDDSTFLDESYFNPIWRSIDGRLVALESLSVSWQGTIDTLTYLGLTRLNEVLQPTFLQVENLGSQASAIVLEMEQNRDNESGDITAFKLEINQEIDQFKNQKTAEIQSVLDQMNDAYTQLQNFSIIGFPAADMNQGQTLKAGSNGTLEADGWIEVTGSYTAKPSDKILMVGVVDIQLPAVSFISDMYIKQKSGNPEDVRIRRPLGWTLAGESDDINEWDSKGIVGIISDPTAKDWSGL